MFLGLFCCKEKLIRGYGGGVVIATQEIPDLVSSAQGRAVLNNTSIKMLLHMESTDCEAVAQHIPLSELEKRSLARAPKGTALLLSGSNRVNISISPSEFELRTFTTDPNLLKKFAQEDAEKDGSSGPPKKKRAVKRKVVKRKPA